METLIDKLKGTIYGQAIGDALGLGTEGMTDEDMAWKYPNGITHYSDIFQDRHRKRWKIGDWTDDTDMMLCIANAVVKDKGVNLTSIAQNFKDWDMGEPMGIGETTYKVLILADYVEKPFEDLGNGTSQRSCQWRLDANFGCWYFSKSSRRMCCKYMPSDPL